jgi:hypothetical protein
MLELNFGWPKFDGFYRFRTDYWLSFVGIESEFCGRDVWWSVFEYVG